MWTLADRIVKAVSDVTIGTVIVLAHVTLAKREASRQRAPLDQTLPDGSRVWRTQISP